MRFAFALLLVVAGCSSASHVDGDAADDSGVLGAGDSAAPDTIVSPSDARAETSSPDASDAAAPTLGHRCNEPGEYQWICGFDTLSCQTDHNPVGPDMFHRCSMRCEAAGHLDASRCEGYGGKCVDQGAGFPLCVPK